MYINFKTEYNLKDSYVRLEDLVSVAKRDYLETVGICDYASTQSFFKMNKLAKEADVNVLYGVEFYYQGQVILLYAKNNAGILRLNELVTLYHQDNALPLYNETDLIAVLAKGQVIDDYIKTQDESGIRKLASKFSEGDFYVGVFSATNDSNNYRIFEALNKTNFKLVLVDPIKYLAEEDLETYLTLKAMKEEKFFVHFQQMRVKAKKYCYRQVINPVYAPMLENIKEIAEKCSCDLEQIHYEKPKYPFVPEGKSSTKYLQEMINTGLKWRFGSELKQEYVDRIQSEYKMIVQMGFADYFLIVQDIVIYAKRNNIAVGPGRGSAAGSLIAYVLGITDINPVQYGLYFERFLNPARQTMPDIDLDFAGDKREAIIEYIIDHFGQERVCKIGTISRFLAKSAFREVAKIWGVDKKTIELISKQLSSGKSLEENMNSNKKLNQMVMTDQQLKNVFRICNAIEGMPNNYSVHAAGIIIGNGEVAPFIAQNKDHVSYLEAAELEKIGLLKVDILALDNLTILDKIIKNVEGQIGQNFNIKAIPLNDQRTFELLSTAQTFGIFQMESDGMRNVLAQIQPKTFSELALVLAMFRPGAKSQLEDYLKNRGNFVVANKVDKILEETSGVIIYQEQIMQIVTTMGNYSLIESDLIRRAISKKDQTTMNEFASDFIKRSMENGYEQNYVRHMAELIIRFGEYGFNKSHAYSYAMIAYQLAYLKANYPTSFYEEIFVQNFKGDKSRKFIQELQNNNLNLQNPHIRYSDNHVSIIKNHIFLGFQYIKGIGKDTADKLIEARSKIQNFNNLEEVVNKCIKDINLTNREIEALVDAGTFDYLLYNHPTLMENIHNMQLGDVSNIAKLFGEPLVVSEKPDYTLGELAKREKNVLGINIRYNIFEEQKRKFEEKYKQRIYSAREIKYEHFKTGRTEFICIMRIDGVKEITTKKGDRMAFIQIESDGQYDLTCFPNRYREIVPKINAYQGKYVIALIKYSSDKLYLEKM